MEKQTLLEKAKQLKVNKRRNTLSDEEYELGLAWAKGEISANQIMIVTEYKNINSVSTLLNKTLERFYRETIKPQ